MNLPTDWPLWRVTVEDPDTGYGVSTEQTEIAVPAPRVSRSLIPRRSGIGLWVVVEKREEAA